MVSLATNRDSWQNGSNIFCNTAPPKHPTLTHSRPPTPLSQAGSCREQNPQLHPISFLINDTNYRALNSMCLRMGEDTQAAISLSLNSLFISLIYFLSLPSPDAHESPIPSLQVPFLNSPLFFFSSFNHLSALFVLPSGTYSISSLASPFCLHRFLPASYWEAAMPSYNLDNAGCCACASSSVCARVCLSLRDRCKDLALIQTAINVRPTNGGRKNLKK